MVDSRQPGGGATDDARQDSRTAVAAGTEPRWPAIEAEERPWTPTVDDARLSVYERLRTGRPYKAALVPQIAEVTPRLGEQALALQQEASVEIARFDAALASAPVPMPAVLLRTESASSSQIEHVTASSRNIALAEIGLGGKDDARLVAANTRAMRAAMDIGDEVDGDTILAVHRALLERSDPDVAGQWRDQQVWVGSSSLSPHGADYVAPHHDHLPALIDDLTRFAARVDIPPLVHAALVHAQFETIHPFVDGNGRTGRVLLHTMMRRGHLTRHMTVPVSAGLLRDPRAYFDALTAYRQGDPDRIVTEVSHAALAAIANGSQLADEIVEIRDRWRTVIRARRGAAAWALADRLFERPVVDVPTAAGLVGVSDRAALTAIDTLTEAGILRPVSAARRNRAWQADDVLAAMDAFARRAGRRRRG